MTPERETEELFLIRHQGDGADARLIQGRVQMAAHVRAMTVGSDDIETVSDSGMTEHLRILLDANDSEWSEHGEPPSYVMDFEDGSVAVYLVTSTDVPDLASAEREKAASAMREAVDLQYMLEAYYVMLGPKARKLADKWRASGVRRQHTSWGPEAHRLTGEERAQLLLDVETAPKTPLLFDDPPMSGEVQVYYKDRLGDLSRGS